MKLKKEYRTEFKISSRRWIIRLIDLKGSLDALYQTKEYCQDQDQYSHPKGVPLNTVAPVIPPLGECAWPGVIENLFQDHQPVVPILEMLDLAIICSKISTLDNSWIQLFDGGDLVIPPFGIIVSLRK